MAIRALLSFDSTDLIAKSKICGRCKKSKLLSKFHLNRNRKDNHSVVCKICAGKYSREWITKNKFYQKALNRARSLKDRLEVLSICGKGKIKCFCCGEKNFEFLAVDHIHGGGTKHLKSIGMYIGNAVRESKGKGYRILCHNCNFSFHLNRKYKYRCPHKIGFKEMSVDVLDRDAKFRKNRKNKIFEAYGGKNPKCVCCRNTIKEFLTIDHTNGGGLKHHTKLRNNGDELQAWLIRNNFPKGFQLLCFNCNKANGAYGYCPHNHPLNLKQRIREILKKGEVRGFVNFNRNSIRYGERNGLAKLNWEKVFKIRRLYKTNGYSQRNLADLFKISQPTIEKVVNNKTWVQS